MVGIEKDEDNTDGYLGVLLLCVHSPETTKGVGVKANKS